MRLVSEGASGDVSLAPKQEPLVSRGGKTKEGSWVIGGAAVLKEEKETSEPELSRVLEGDAEREHGGLEVAIIAVDGSGIVEVGEMGNAEDIPRTG